MQKLCGDLQNYLHNGIIQEEKRNKGKVAADFGGKSMLDKLTSAVLGIVNAASDGSYKVIDSGEFIKALPEKIKTDATGISNALSYLAERGYVDIRYSDKTTYCVCSLPKGRTYEEGVTADKSRGKRSFRNQLLLTFFGALLGAFVGGCLAGILFRFL